jgi:endonuclease/exonuclease/phosphatase family metal-dependent hydrolase
MTQQIAASTVEHRLAARGVRGLLSGGSSWSNIFAGGAGESHFCSATAGLDQLLAALHPLRVLGLVLFHGWSVFRVLANLAAETSLALWDFARGTIAGRHLWAELRFVPERVLVSAVLREIVTAGACVDVERGLPIVHLNLLGYDEHAHRRGPDSRFAMWALRGIDRTVRRVWLAAHRSPNRDYRVWIYSDHGQERVRAWSTEHGVDASEAIRSVLRELGHRGEITAAIDTASLAGVSGVGGASARPVHIRQELPPWWRVGRARMTVDAPGAAVPEDEPVIVHRGTIGFVYLPRTFDRARRDELAAAMAHRAGIPTVLVTEGDGARVFTRDGLELRLPGDAARVFGGDPARAELLQEDALRLVRHRDAGDIVLWSWHPSQPYSFKTENGAHGGPGPRETGAFLVVPSEASPQIPAGGVLRPLDLRELALGALDPGRSRLAPKRDGAAGESAPKCRLVTYNVHGCRGMDGRFSVERITRVLARTRPDVVCLQELDQSRRRSGGFDQAHEIANRLAKSYRFHAVSELDDGRFGNAVLCSHPMRLVEAGPLPALDTMLSLEPRGVLWVEVDAHGARFQVLNTHLSILERERRLQVEELLTWVERARRHGPVVLAGDLNATGDSWVARRLSTGLHDLVEREAGSRDASPPRTWSSRVPLRRIDHVFASDDVRAARVEVPRSRLARVASDHLPVIVEMDLPAFGGPRAADVRTGGGLSLSRG